MAQIAGNSGYQLVDRIKRLWPALTEEEISCHEGLRDVFFMAVRKRYGLPRAQAEELLRNLVRYASYEGAA